MQSLTDTYTKSDIHDVAQGYQVGWNIIWPEAPINNGNFVSLVPGDISQTSDAPAFDPGLRININPGGNDMGILFLLMEVSECFNINIGPPDNHRWMFPNGPPGQRSRDYITTFIISSTDNKTCRPRCTTILLMIPVMTIVKGTRILQIR
jgi:hypothetical protein